MRYLLAVLALCLSWPVLAYEAPANPAAVRDGTTLTVTWEHSGDAKSFSVWQGTPGKIFTGSVVTPGATARTSVFTVPSAEEAPELCGIYVVARYLPEQPNQASVKFCATEAAEPSPGNGELPVGEGTATLTWTPPTEREDGTPLPEAEILGYHLYADTTSPPAAKQVTTSSNARTWTYTGLGEGTWYFAAQTIDTDDQVSQLSEIVSKEIKPPPADQVAPVITLLGGNPLTLPRNAVYVEEGAFCDDDVDGDLSEFVEITGTVDTKTPGTYALTYTCTDMSGNTASANRAITVLQRAKPLPPALQGE